MSGRQGQRSGPAQPALGGGARPQRPTETEPHCPCVLPLPQQPPSFFWHTDPPPLLLEALYSLSRQHRHFKIHWGGLFHPAEAPVSHTPPQASILRVCACPPSSRTERIVSRPFLPPRVAEGPGKKEQKKAALTGYTCWTSKDIL